MDPLKAFYSDGTEEYCRTFAVGASENVEIRLRTPKKMQVKPQFMCDYTNIEMELCDSGPFFDYYSCEIIMPNERLSYAFKIVYNDRIYYYTKNGLKDYYEWQDSLRLLPGFRVPKWATGAVMYQIYPDRFCNGNKNNDVENGEYYYADRPVEKVYDWNSPVADLDVARFYGGDLAGVLKKLDYLSDLGVEVIYLNPIFVSPSNHKYDCQDYDHIDPHLTVISKDIGAPGVYGNNRYVIRTTDKDNLEASNKWFAEFVSQVHARGMKVILDGVFNHCGSFNKWMDREGYYSAYDESEAGAYRSKESKYRKYFKFSDPDDPNSYEGWWGFDTLPKLNYEESEELCEYICNIGAKWVSPPYNCDGWRLDVAADLGHSEEFNHKFWKRFRKAVKEANPDSLILAEHYGNAENWLKGDEWDTLMNYDAFMEPITWFLTGMEKHSDEYREYMLNNTDALVDGLFNRAKAFSTATMYAAMNELSNHDHSRFLTRTNHYVGRVQQLGAEAASRDISREIFAEAVVFQMTWPGCPTIYYGDEAGLCGFTDPDSRRTYPWGREDHELIRLHKDMIAVRKRLSVLKLGSVTPLYTERGVFAYARFDRENIVVTVLNNNDYEKDLTISLESIDIDMSAMVTIMLTDEDGFRREARFCRVYDRKFSIHMKPHSSCVLKDLDP